MLTLSRKLNECKPLMLGIAVKPRLFTTVVWALGELFKIPLVAIVEAAFLLIEGVIIALDAAETLVELAQSAWQFALDALSLFGKAVQVDPGLTPG